MNKKSVAAVRAGLSEILDEVEAGAEVEIQRRNVPIAKIIPIKRATKNKTKLNSGKGSVKFLGDIVASPMKDDWEMHR